MADYNALILFEDEISNLLDGTTTVDGHDFGSEEANIYIITEKPEADFKTIKTALGKRLEKRKIKIAYREIGTLKYTSLYPSGAEKFTIK